MLHYFDHILVQNQESVELTDQHWHHQRNTRGRYALRPGGAGAATKKAIPLAEAFKNKRPLLVIGSAWHEDMDVLIPFLNTFPQPLKVIIAPHEIHDDEIERWRSQLTKPRFVSRRQAEADAATAEILIIDNVGMLSSLYQYGEFAYIGGAFKQGLHNILEAATFGMPLFFGPEYDKYQEASRFSQEGAAFPVRQRRRADRSVHKTV